MNRAFLACVFAAFFLLSGCGPDKPKVAHIGILCGLDVLSSAVDGFREKMAELGHVEGKTILYDIQRSNFDQTKDKKILRSFVDKKVDLIVALPTEAALEAKAAIRGTDIPLVFCQANIEGVDLVKSIREPGGNVTGVRFPGPDLTLKRFEVLHEMVPRAKRFWIPYWKDAPVVPSQLKILHPFAAKEGITLVESPFTDAAELEADLEKRSNDADVGFDAILFITEPLTTTSTAYPKIGQFAAERRLPVGGVQTSMGGYTTVFGVAADSFAAGKLAAQQAHKILKGVPAGTIPVMSAEIYLYIHYTAAQALGLNVPEGLLKQANKVIRLPVEH